MRKGILLAVIACVCFLSINVIAAQSGGQFCVRSYADANANGIFDPDSETLLTRGVTIELLDAATNVVIATAMLDRSPNADSGIVCFQNLTDADYSVVISSADYIATTPRLLTRTVSSTGLPVVIEFGAQRRTETAPVTERAPLFVSPADMSQDELRDFVTRVAFSTVGAIIVMMFTLVIGFMIYMIRVQPRRVVAAPAYSYTPPTIPEPPPSLEDTGQSSRID